LGPESRYCSNHSGRQRKSAGNNSAGIHGRLERAPPDLSAKRIEKQIAGLSYSTGDHEDIRIEAVEQIGNTDTEEVRCIANNF
jgi:hypothetical protein